MSFAIGKTCNNFDTAVVVNRRRKCCPLAPYLRRLTCMDRLPEPGDELIDAYTLDALQDGKHRGDWSTFRCETADLSVTRPIIRRLLITSSLVYLERADGGSVGWPVDAGAYC